MPRTIAARSETRPASTFRPRSPSSHAAPRTATRSGANRARSPIDSAVRPPATASFRPAALTRFDKVNQPASSRAVRDLSNVSIKIPATSGRGGGDGQDLVGARSARRFPVGVSHGHPAANTRSAGGPSGSASRPASPARRGPVRSCKTPRPSNASGRSVGPNASRHSASSPSATLTGMRDATARRRRARPPAGPVPARLRRAL